MSRHDATTLPSDLRWPVKPDPPALEAGTVQVWCALLQCEPATLTRWRLLLPEGELQRAARFRTGLLRDRFVLSRIVLRRILGGVLGAAPGRIRFESDTKGKPRPCDAGGVEFNLSHTADLMLLAVTREAAVGVDLERVRAMKDCRSIAERFFTRRESDWLGQFDGAALERAFFSLWTRKEAILKATGEGISSGLDSLELLESGGTFRSSVSRGADAGSGAGWSVTALRPARGFIGALALPEAFTGSSLQLASYQLD